MVGTGTCLYLRPNEICVWTRTIYSFLPGELGYLVKDKDPKNVLQASEYADSISGIRDPQFSEIKFGRKVWDDSKSSKNKSYPSQLQAKGSHFKARPSFPEIPDFSPLNISEGSVNKSPYSEHRTNKKCFFPVEKMDIFGLNVKLKRIGILVSLKVEITFSLKKLLQSSVAEVSSSAVAKETDLAESPEIPEARVVQCFLIKCNQDLLNNSGESTVFRLTT